MAKVLLCHKKMQKEHDKLVEEQKRINDQLGADGKAPDASKVNKFAGAVEKGTIEAYRAEIATRGQGPEKETAKNTKEQVNVTKLLLEATNKTNDLIESGFPGVANFNLEGA